VLNWAPCHDYISLCLIKHHVINTYWGWRIAPCILNLCSRWRWMVSFTSRPVYSEAKVPGRRTNSIEGSVVPWAGLDVLLKRILPLHAGNWTMVIHSILLAELCAVSVTRLCRVEWDGCMWWICRDTERNSRSLCHRTIHDFAKKIRGLSRLLQSA
jgi:hypothetical protein